MEENEFNENEIIVENLNDFLTHISDMRKAIQKEEGQRADSQKFFFRGQANYNWDVLPGIFRNKYSESDLIYNAYLRNPSEFSTLSTDFEKLAKLQHYGLPTRLLDVTSNPLVALYFACQENEEKNDEDNTTTKTDGCVLFSRAYSKGYNDLEIAVISHLANIKIEGDFTLDKLLDELVDKRIYTAKSAEDCRKGQYKSLIEILQNNYFVVSNLNNERLVRQSGLFLLVGKYNIGFNDENIEQSTIQIAKSSAKSDFDQTIFRIPEDKKKEILDELDFYNINEGALFPELEHQMTYIKTSRSGETALDVESFTKVTSHNNSKAETIINQRELTDREIEEIIDKILEKSLSKFLFDECKVAIMDNISVDWYKRETIISKIKIALTEVLCKYNMIRVDAKLIASSIVDKIINEINNIA